MGQRTAINIKREFGLQKFNIGIFLFTMFGIFPLFHLEQGKYNNIGSIKYTLFWYSSLIFLGLSIVFLVVRVLYNVSMGKRSKNIILVEGQRFYSIKLSYPDRAVLAYGLCVLLSFLLSPYKEFALKGAEGWSMGLYSQLIFIGTYFFLSRFTGWRKLVKGVVVLHLIVSGVVFLLGILHRFNVDPLGFYPGLSLDQKRQFLSSIGQATWYSSYVCTVFALGLVVFYLSRRQWIQIGAAVYMVLSFATLVTQNSDSAFVALGAVMVLLGGFSFSSRERLTRFFQIMVFLWGSFGAMGILRKIFQDRIIPLDSLSAFFFGSALPWICLILFLGMYLWIEKREEESIARLLNIGKKVYVGIVILMILGILAAVLFIFLNTKGYLLSWFGYQSANPYFFFDYHWGNNRGSSWMIAWQQFGQLPWYQKLFGVGPDSFSIHLYSIPETNELLRALWGNLSLTNAHNEYLNHLICYGFMGTAAWLAVLGGGIRYFYLKAEEDPVFIGFALCMIAYAFHNFFCYQQVCCTPFVFILLGIGEGLTKSGKSPTIIY